MVLGGVIHLEGFWGCNAASLTTQRDHISAQLHTEQNAAEHRGRIHPKHTRYERQRAGRSTDGDALLRVERIQRQTHGTERTVYPCAPTNRRCRLWKLHPHHSNTIEISLPHSTHSFPRHLLLTGRMRHQSHRPPAKHLPPIRLPTR